MQMNQNIYSYKKYTQHQDNKNCTYISSCGQMWSAKNDVTKLGSEARSQSYKRNFVLKKSTLVLNLLMARYVN